jgi:hypothetical protein
MASSSKFSKKPRARRVAEIPFLTAFLARKGGCMPKLVRLSVINKITLIKLFVV